MNNFDEKLLLFKILFSLKELDAEQKLRRSFHLYDRNETKKISKREMVEVSAKSHTRFGSRLSNNNAAEISMGPLKNVTQQIKELAK